jgi:hypothetical protein
MYYGKVSKLDRTQAGGWGLILAQGLGHVRFSLSQVKGKGYAHEIEVGDIVSFELAPGSAGSLGRPRAIDVRLSDEKIMRRSLGSGASVSQPSHSAVPRH